MKGNEENYFRIVSVDYGDLKGDGQDEAVVLGACGGVGNFEIGDIIIFSASPRGPRLLAELSPSDWGKGEEDNGGDCQVSGLHVTKQQLAYLSRRITRMPRVDRHGEISMERQPLLAHAIRSEAVQMSVNC